MIPELLFTVLAIINATVPVGNGEVQVPFSVQPLATPPQQQGITPQSPAATQSTGGANIGGIQIDQATLTTLTTVAIGAIGGLAYKNKKDKEQENRRDNVIADTSLKQVMSQKETDKGVMELSNLFAEFARATASDKPELVAKVERMAKEHCLDYKAYYEEIQPQPLDYDKDPVVKKLSAVQKRTAPA